MTIPDDTHAATFVVCHPVDEERVRKVAWPRTKIITSSLMPPENSYAFATLDEAQQFVQDAEDAFTKLTDRETEAAIRKQIAEEVREHIKLAGMVRGRDSQRRQGYVEGLRAALRIIERGTGVAGEGEG